MFVLSCLPPFHLVTVTEPCIRHPVSQHAAIPLFPIFVKIAKLQMTWIIMGLGVNMCLVTDGCWNFDIFEASVDDIFWSRLQLTSTLWVNLYRIWNHLTEHKIRWVKQTSIDSIYVIYSPNPMFDHLLESSRWDDSNKWSSIGFGEEIGILEIKICSISGALT